MENYFKDIRRREILSLETRALMTLGTHYSKIFRHREFWLDLIPKQLRKQLFTLLVHKGTLDNELFRRIIDDNTDILDVKSASFMNSRSCKIIQKLGRNIRILYCENVTARSNDLVEMFSSLHRLTTLEIQFTASFDDACVKAIVEASPCIKVLNMKKTGITDLAMSFIAQGCSCIIALDISQTKVSFVGIEKLILSQTGKTLRELKTRGSELRGREEILSTVLGFPNLSEYSFEFNSNEEADWVLSRVMESQRKLKNFTFTIPL